ncbi:hypothetical protein [Lentimonas sp. CC8]|uniref:hypothetical protein n=2 Tax=Lentimonas TaxID=417293 RepID=UPI0013897890|nr:hypothetical protein [Lentimonas sp. CC8]
MAKKNQMSYDLYFWREERNLKNDPQDVIETLSADKPIAGIATFSRDKIREKFKLDFPGIVDGDISLDWEGEGSYFQVSFTHADKMSVNCIIVTCGYKLLDSPDTMNRIIDVGSHFGCALYDPQTNERYQQPNSQPVE